MLNEPRRTLGYLNWLLNPLQRIGPESIYDLIGSDVPSARGSYLNLGYWDQADSLDDACEDLVRLVGETAGLSSADRILDCGYGFGEQDIYWARRFCPASIVGLNVTASQVEQARRRVEEAGLSSIVDLRVGSATEMPLPDESFDAVIALESAFHFRPRSCFFREAFRVLAPGGRLVTADIIPRHSPSPNRSLAWRLTANKFSIPDANAYAADRYRGLLESNGFEKTTVRSIREDVYTPLHRYLRAHPEVLKRLHPIALFPAQITLMMDPEKVFDSLDYVIASAKKPAQVQ